MKVTIKEESPDGTIVESSVTFEKEEKVPSEEDETDHLSPGPIAVCGLKSLFCFLFGGSCCGRKRSS